MKIGWDATSDVVDDWVFDEITKKHLLDKEMRNFYEENNPWAIEELARRFLEVEQRGLWKADPQVLKDLKESYLEIDAFISEHPFKPLVRTEGVWSRQYRGLADYRSRPVFRGTQSSCHGGWIELV